MVDALRGEQVKRIDEAVSTVAQVRREQEAAQRALEVQVINLRVDLLKQQRRQLLGKGQLSPLERADLQEINEEIGKLQKRLERVASA